MMDPDHGGGADEAEAAFFARRSRRCCCFPCWPSTSSSSTSLSHQRIGAAASEEESWWQGGVDALLKVREWSELAAGPRWKTFIRRFGRNNNGGGGPRPHGNFGRKLNYDALSYALNFDEGPGATPEPGDHAAFRDFSSRFAAPPASAKSSMDLGGRDAPTLFAPPPNADGADRRS